MRMRFRFPAVAAAGLLLFCSGANAVDLDDYQWQHRLLLLFAPDEENAAYTSAVAAVAGRTADVADRDLMVFHVFENGASRVDGRSLSSSDARRLRNRFDIGPGRLTVVLIGKDGGVKLVQRNALDLPAVFDRIDAMPMRQREMREKKSPS